MRTLHLLPAAWLLLAFLGGCATLDRGLVRLDALSECTPQEPAALNQLGPLSPNRPLECALGYLRGTQDPKLLGGPLASRIALHLAERETDPQRREKLAAEGVRFAERALELGAQGDGAVHYYLAANLGLAVRDHATLGLENLPRLEAEMKRAVALNPDLDGGGPLRLLGTLYLRAPAWPSGIGDGDKALELLKQAVERHPGHPLNRLFLAEALWEVEGDDGLEQAKAELAKGMKLLREGNWGYSKAPWEREFAETRKEIDDEARVSAPAASLADARPNMGR